MKRSEPVDSEAPPPAVVVDPRLAQANERTMLAWIRTGLALIAFGFVIARLGGWLRLISAAVGPTVASDHWTQAEAGWIGALFVMSGTVSNAAAIVRYVAARRAIRLGREVADGLFPIMFGIIVTAVGGVVGFYLLWRMA